MDELLDMYARQAAKRRANTEELRQNRKVIRRKIKKLAVEGKELYVPKPVVAPSRRDYGDSDLLFSSLE